MKKSILVLIIFIGFIGTSKAQPQLYHTAIGVNLGSNYGLNLKHFLSSKTAVEAIANFHYGPGITGLFEFSFRHPFNVDELDWFVGFGAHAHFIAFGVPNPYYNNLEPAVNVGVDGIIGMEYTFKNIPLNLGANFKPALNFTANRIIWWDAAITARYILKR